MGQLEDAIARIAGLMKPGWGEFRPADHARAREGAGPLDLPDSLRAFYRTANPVDFEIPWIVEVVRLHGAEELWDWQAGYRYPADRPNERLEGWRTDWIAIGDILGDPIIVDGLGHVHLAVHGAGEWQPLQVASSPEDFLAVLGGWLAIWCTRQGIVTDANCVLRSDVRAEIEENVLAHVTAVERQNFLRWLAT